jgi:hypothetical protein
MGMEQGDTTKSVASTDLDVSRREFLKRAGKVIVYTPPAMLAMSSPSFRAIAQSSGGGDQTAPNGGWLADLLRWLFGRR